MTQELESNATRDATLGTSGSRWMPRPIHPGIK